MGDERAMNSSYKIGLCIDGIERDVYVSRVPVVGDDVQIKREDGFVVVRISKVLLFGMTDAWNPSSSRQAFCWAAVSSPA